MLYRYSFFIVLLSIIFHFSSALDAPPSKLYKVDEEAYNVYKTRICNVLPFGGGALPPWSDKLTEDEIYEFALLVLGNQLQNDAIAQISAKLGWKKRIVDLMAYVTQTSCGSSALTSSYVSVAKNLFLYYILKYETSMNATAKAGEDDDPTSGQEWKEIIETISTCSKNIEQIPVSEHCGAFTNYQGQDGRWLPMPTHLEQFDKELEPPNGDGVDVIVDSMWWMFSITYARCYSYFYPNEDVILLFFQRFRDDILSSFVNRWRGGGHLVDHFSVVFGPINAYQEFDNLRLCSGAAFQYENLAGRELVRPVTVLAGTTPMMNFKTSV